MIDLTRRSLIALPALLGLTPAVAQASKLNDDGLHTEDWFLESFLDLKQDIEDAAGKGKRVAMTFEQRGCPACAKMHEQHLADPAINGYIRQHFEIVQINMFGARDVTDLDGKVLPEKQMARRWSITATPTILFLPEKPAAGTAKDLASARMQGLLPPPAFLAMFRFVVEHAYEKMEFPTYLAQQQPGASSAAFSSPTN